MNKPLAVAALYAVGVSAIPAQSVGENEGAAETVGARCAAAMEVASKENKRVLLLIGSDAAHADLAPWTKGERELGRLLSYEYEQVPVALSAGDAGRELAARYQVAGDGQGLLALVVLDGRGELVAKRPVAEGALTAKQLHEFLDRAKAEPLDAEVVLAEALERAVRENKRVFVHLGAPW